MSQATWERLSHRTGTGWDVVCVYTTAYNGMRVFHGIAHTKPSESQSQNETRIANEKGIKKEKMILEIVG